MNCIVILVEVCGCSLIIMNSKVCLRAAVLAERSAFGLEVSSQWGFHVQVIVDVAALLRRVNLTFNQLLLIVHVHVLWSAGD